MVKKANLYKGGIFVFNCTEKENKMKNQVDEAFNDISAGKYESARAKLAELRVKGLSDRAKFNIKYGLAVCCFNLNSFDDAISNGLDAAKLVNGHFDVHLILAQCYAAKYFMENDEDFRQLARREYEKSKSLVHKRPGADPCALEAKIIQLEGELENGTGHIYN